MQHAQQPPGSSLCGQTCLAMLAGITLEQAIAAVGHRRGTRTEELRRELRRLGIRTTAFRENNTYVTDEILHSLPLKEGTLPALVGWAMPRRRIAHSAAGAWRFWRLQHTAHWIIIDTTGPRDTWGVHDPTFDCRIPYDFYAAVMQVMKGYIFNFTVCTPQTKGR